MITAIVSALAAAGLALGCEEPPPPQPRVEVDALSVLVEAQEPVREVIVQTAAGAVLARRDVQGDAEQVRLRHGAKPETTLKIVGRTARAAFSVHAVVPAPLPDPSVTIDVPVGQGARRVSDGDTLEFDSVEGSSAMAAVVVSSRTPGRVLLAVGEHLRTVQIRVAGERRLETFKLPSDDREVALRVTTGATTLSATLVPRIISQSDARAALELVDVVFPADASGSPEAARPPGRVDLPAAWWQEVLLRLGLGYRARHYHAPWAHQAVTLRNRSDRALNVVLRSRVLKDGEPAEAFRPRLRAASGDTGIVSGLLRVPARSEATAVLPLFVSDDALDAGAQEFVREIAVTPLGSERALWRDTAPLRTRRGSGFISFGFLLALVSAIGGVLLVGRGLPRWLRDFRTADLTTIAVFGTLAFVVSAASALVSAGLGAVLGPFQTFLTAIFDDALRYALLATLVTLIPRPGVLALSVIVAWLMRGFALGGFNPTDALSVFGHIFWLESCLWAVGVTRSGAWRDGPRVGRFLRLGAGFATASLLSALGGLLVHMVLFRLFYAGWYVAALLALPGFLYVWTACLLATGFADSLRRVES